MEDLEAKFIKKYANLPWGAREEIIAVIDGKNFTWNSANIEIDRGKEGPTEIGQKILKQLQDLRIFE
ncbi:hypothetical protein HYT60_00280 [Candidatus Woesebacteria bacterium]|nr:hypothetical protein [Candidatus Woesebacteria bacterium]